MFFMIMIVVDFYSVSWVLRSVSSDLPSNVVRARRPPKA